MRILELQIDGALVTGAEQHRARRPDVWMCGERAMVHRDVLPRLRSISELPLEFDGRRQTASGMLSMGRKGGGRGKVIAHNLSAGFTLRE